MNTIEYLKNIETKDQIINLIRNNLDLYKGINTKTKVVVYTGLLYNMFVKECVQNNQYISLSNTSIKEVNKLYRQLIEHLRKIDSYNFDDNIYKIVNNHRSALIKIIESNEYSENTNQLIIPCSEYSAEFQEKILRMINKKLIEPIIDIGCGKNCNLVKRLKAAGYKKVYGIDQYENNNEFILASNWFEFEFCKNTYGTIISHMAFSNHFKRTIVLNDKKKELFENKYFEILDSLKQGGIFVYSPALEIIENKIDKEKYLIQRYKNTQDTELDTVEIKRL
jgi:hypothetical protein